MAKAYSFVYLLILERFSKGIKSYIFGKPLEICSLLSTANATTRDKLLVPNYTPMS